MRVWITSFLVLFGMAELYQWVKHFTLPLPVYILGGAFLAIASNYERRFGSLSPQSNERRADIPSANTPNFSPPTPGGQPTFSNTQSSRPVSFTIRRSNQDPADG